MPRIRIASVAIATLVFTPACSFIIDTNPDGVIRGIGGKGAAAAGKYGTGTSSDGGSANEGGAGALVGGGAAVGFAGSLTTNIGGSSVNPGVAGLAGSIASTPGGTSTSFGGAVVTNGGTTNSVAVAAGTGGTWATSVEFGGSGTAASGGTGGVGGRGTGSANGAAGGMTGAAGSATKCSQGLRDCTDASGCETLLNTISNCGACGTKCNAPANGLANCSSSGSCGFTCDENYTQCGSSCVNTSNDPYNCGACGHNCLGGTCSASVCQPITLGTVATGAGDSLIVSDGAVYAITAAIRVTPAVWRLDANVPSTPVSVLSGVYTTPRCIMSGKMYWVSSDSGTYAPGAISYCSVSDCTATTQHFTTSPGQVQAYPICDLSTSELVWSDRTKGLSEDSWVETIYRAAANGTNIRAMTTILCTSNYSRTDIGFVSQRADRYFFAVEDVTSTPRVETLYYVPTNVQNVSPISLVTGNSGQNGINVGYTEFANDSLFVWADNSGYTPQQSFSLALPNGILSGLPPVFGPRLGNGVMDSQYLYGVFASLPSDAIGKCALRDCTNPSILFRGAANAAGFTQDATAIYWLTPGIGVVGFTVWKAAK
ncbi:MAG TPA: hypothetical protein VIV60_23315 [Polyangiaceae bacterium]